jgi:hypothetical protein
MQKLTLTDAGKRIKQAMIAKGRIRAGFLG